MPDDPRASAPDRDAFEDEERPTRPAPPPSQEHLRLLRRTPAPPRRRPAARRRPSLTAIAKNWVAAPSTTTSRWRAVAATVLGGGAGRASLVDPHEMAASPASAPTPSPVPALALALAPTPALSTLKMSPPPVIETPETDAADDSLPNLVGDARRRVVRRGMVAACVVLLGAWSVWFALRGHVQAPTAAEGTATSPTPSAHALPVPGPTTPPPSSTASGATAPSSHDLPSAAPSHRGRRHLSPSETSEIL